VIFTENRTLGGSVLRDPRLFQRGCWRLEYSTRSIFTPHRLITSHKTYFLSFSHPLLLTLFCHSHFWPIWQYRHFVVLLLECNCDFQCSWVFIIHSLLPWILCTFSLQFHNKFDKWDPNNYIYSLILFCCTLVTFLAYRSKLCLFQRRWLSFWLEVIQNFNIIYLFSIEEYVSLLCKAPLVPIKRAYTRISTSHL
jgi:hypothetical protein